MVGRQKKSPLHGCNHAEGGIVKAGAKTFLSYRNIALPAKLFLAAPNEVGRLIIQARNRRYSVGRKGGQQ